MQIDRRTFVSSGAVLGAVSLAAPAGAAAATGAMAVWHEQTYVVPATLEATWRAFTDPKERQVWWGYPTDALKDAAEVKPLQFLRSVINHPGLPGITQNRQTFSAVAGGTRIVHGLSGFGDGPVWQNALDNAMNGVDEMIADMALFLRTGAGFPRHVHLRAYDFVQGTCNVPGGLGVLTVMPGTLPAEVGLQSGDTIVSIGSMAVFDVASAHAACRAFAAGDTVEVKWVRGKQVMTATGKMTKTVARRT